MTAREITDEFVAEVAEDLRARYALDDAAIRSLGAGLANRSDHDREAIRSFAEHFIERHQQTFDRLA